MARIMANGVSRVMKSTIPPVSPPAWTTFLTGKNPGSHGIFHFVNMDISDYAFTSNRLINSTIIFRFHVHRFDREQRIEGGHCKDTVYLSALEGEWVYDSGRAQPGLDESPYVSTGNGGKTWARLNLGDSTDFMLYNTEKLLEHLKFDCEIRTKITCDMLDKRESDFFMVVTPPPMRLPTVFGNLQTRLCPNYKASFKKYENIIRDVYVMVDQSVGQIMQKIDDQTTVFLMSDHGAARNPYIIFISMHGCGNKAI